MTVINEGGHCIAVWLQLCLCNSPLPLTTWTGLIICLHNIRPVEIFFLVISNLLEYLGSYQFCGNMPWQYKEIRAGVRPHWIYVITYTFMLVSCNLNHTCPSYTCLSSLCILVSYYSNSLWSLSRLRCICNLVQKYILKYYLHWNSTMLVTSFLALTECSCKS